MQTTLLPVPLVPEISLHLADARTGLFDGSQGEFRSDVAPPFWAFAWAGGQALARYVLDNPHVVAGRRVVDVATGSGIAAIAAARAGAAEVEAFDVSPEAVEAVRRNAAANAVSVEARVAEVTGDASPLPGGADVVLAGDVFYMGSVAERMTAALRRAARTASVLVGDPGRGYLPERLFVRRAEYAVPVPRALEEIETLITGVWEMRSSTNKL
ncbi:class I SAM-dependent methyltransferase [Actinoplanes sp. RD1]|uniref:class I SAM-dependent methyltransferase n=1 Tax=Actinoplanes sp. RD1 TaxID=3064538 RepID=UPI0027408A83|nr:50S ribosomal protein L11 methyltransferase [Actinoplanes sp. RD1]